MNIVELLFDKGRDDALTFQLEAYDMTGTEMYAEKQKIPAFSEAVKVMNMLERHASTTDGFVCRSSAGRVVRLLQNYDSDIFTQEPEELSAQWGFKWSTNPADALPFIALSTSPYNTDECCTENGSTFRSTINNNTWAPSAYPQGWEQIGG